MSGMPGSRVHAWLAFGLIACTACTACGSPPSPTETPEISQACLERIARDALTNPRTNSIAANFAGPLGLVPSSDPDAAPYLSKQAEFRTPDRGTHYFAVDSPQWTKAVLIRVVPTEAEPRMLFFVLARSGDLLSAGRIDDRRFSALDVADAGVQADARAEQGLWKAAGPASPCRRP